MYDPQKHQDLMSRWKAKGLHEGKDFIEDGIIEANRWEVADRKILLLLKEAYGDYGDLCSRIRDKWDGPKYKVWRTASYWLYALQKMSGKTIPSFPNGDEQIDECVEYLLSAAVINIKKSSGKNSSSSADLTNYVTQDGDLLREQIELIDPTIILCGYTFSHFKEIWPDQVKPVGGSENVFMAGKHLVIDWWHPANRYPNRLCYYALCAVVQEADVL